MVGKKKNETTETSNESSTETSNDNTNTEPTKVKQRCGRPKKQLKDEPFDESNTNTTSTSGNILNEQEQAEIIEIKNNVIYLMRYKLVDGVKVDKKLCYIPNDKLYELS